MKAVEEGVELRDLAVAVGKWEGNWVVAGRRVVLRGGDIYDALYIMHYIWYIMHHIQDIADILHVTYSILNIVTMCLSFALHASYHTPGIYYTLQRYLSDMSYLKYCVVHAAYSRLYNAYLCIVYCILL